MTEIITDVKVKVFKCVWKIKNFEHLCLNELGLTSPTFTYGDNDEGSFQLYLWKEGVSSDFNQNALLDTFKLEPIHICTNENYTTYKLYNFIISLLNSDDKEAVTKRKSFSNVYKKDPFENFVTEDFIFDKKNKLLPNGTLTIVCKISIEQGRETYSNRIKEEIGNNSKKITPLSCSNQFENFEQLLEHNEYSDLKLVVNRKEFPVNKCILAARSRVFAAMLEQKMKEPTDGQFVINDIEPEVMREMLRFIYSGKVKDFERMAPSLMVAAEKYELYGLKSACEEILIGNLSVHNVDEVLLLIDKISAEKLKTATIEFIIENTKVLNNSEKFKNIYKCLSSSFLADVTRALMMKLQ